MLSKPESTVSSENSPINPGILELWCWVGEKSSSFKFLHGRAMNYKPKQLNFPLWNFNTLVAANYKPLFKKAIADSLNRGKEY